MSSLAFAQDDDSYDDFINEAPELGVEVPPETLDFMADVAAAQQELTMAIEELEVELDNVVCDPNAMDILAQKRDAVRETRETVQQYYDASHEHAEQLLIKLPLNWMRFIEGTDDGNGSANNGNASANAQNDHSANNGQGPSGGGVLAATYCKTRCGGCGKCMAWATYTTVTELPSGGRTPDSFFDITP